MFVLAWLSNSSWTFFLLKVKGQGLKIQVVNLIESDSILSDGGSSVECEASATGEEVEVGNIATCT